MSIIHAKATEVYVDEFDFGAFMNAVDIAIDNGIAEVTTFADVHAVYLEGKPSFTLDLGGLLDMAAGSYDAEMFIDLTVEDRKIGVYPPGSVDGDFGLEMNTNVGGQERPIDFNSVAILNVSWVGDDLIMRSQIMKKATAIASSVDGTAYQHGAVVSGKKLVGIVRLLAAPGGAGDNDCIVTIESDSQEDFAASLETQLTFTTINQASSALFEVKEKSGAITDDWWRAVVTISGVGSREFNLVIAIGITDA